MSFTSKSNCRHISKVRGDSAWAFGAARRVGYRSMIRDLTVDRKRAFRISQFHIPPSRESMCARSNPVGPPPTIRTGTSTFCDVPIAETSGSWSEWGAIRAISERSPTFQTSMFSQKLSQNSNRFDSKRSSDVKYIASRVYRTIVLDLRSFSASEHQQYGKDNYHAS